MQSVSVATESNATAQAVMDPPPVHVPAVALERGFIEPARAKALIGDLLTPRPLIYWADLLTCIGLGYGGFAVAFRTTALSPVWVAACLIASLALYRALIFSHEVAHLKPGTVPGFKLAWNIFVGIPLLMPSVFYSGVHDDHHRTQTYGTDGDPEYRPFAGARAEIIFFTLHSVLIYPVLALRMFVISPLALLIPPLHRLVERKASSFTMNPRYDRKMNTKQRRELICMEFVTLMFWTALIVVLARLGMHWRFLMIYAAILQPAAVVNSLRTLVAHRYETDGHARAKEEQILDSIDTPGNLLSALWAPVGLRFHALHHFFPTIPYHNMSTAYARLVEALPQNNRYHQTRSKSLWSSMKQLWAGKQS
jgi:fatty acid desaturase